MTKGCRRSLESVRPIVSNRPGPSNQSLGADSMVEPTQLRQTIRAFWCGMIKGDGRITEYDLIKTLSAMGARPSEILDAILETEHLSRGFAAAIASDIADTLPGFGLQVATHLQARAGGHRVHQDAPVRGLQGQGTKQPRCTCAP